MGEVGCERTPNLIDAAARFRVLCALGNTVSENQEHSRYLVNAGIQARVVRRRDHREVMRQKDVIIQFSR
jgi:hypothetical protein